MDLLGKMVGAPGPSAAALAETRTDAELIADIAPAMLIKLREDGVAKGSSWGTVLFLLWQIFFFSDLALGRLNPNDRFFAPEVYLWAIPVQVACWIVLHYYFKRRSVSVEIQYRRQHGKWRWEH